MKLLLIALSMLVSIVQGTHAQADKRVALVIGNSAYLHTSSLANPRNDATDIATAFVGSRLPGD